MIEATPKGQKKAKGGLGETIKTVVYAGLIAAFIRTILFEPFNIPSGSMIPSLLVGDYLFVSKYSYGYSKHSMPFSVPLFEGRIAYTPPERGDIAVFKLPLDNRTDYIKRIIGLPGDIVQMRAGVVHINSQPVTRARVSDYVIRDERGNVIRMAQYVETLPNGRSYNVIKANDIGKLDDTDPYRVPADHYFMMGDNRDNSLDSRVLSHVGFVPAENLVGRAEILFFSTDGSSAWFEPWKWPFAVRYNRILRKVT